MDAPQYPKARFKVNFARIAKPSDPEALFRDLKSQSVQGLWSQQAELLRAYAKDHQVTPDIAFELPTGTGKTLIGLLLAEYRWRAFDERVAYLCPTRQLAHQAAEHAVSYGLRPALLLRPDYAGINDYRLGEEIGITTYSSVFNSNPRINDAQSIVLDDAHAAENYIINPWSLNITRTERPILFEELVQLLARDLPRDDLDILLEDRVPDALALSKVSLLPGPALFRNLDGIRDLIDSYFERCDDDGRFSWSKIRASLHACNLFVSWHEFLLRPVIPPTSTHPAFADARQRIYMSATLGEGGELERITGVRAIRRLPMPEGWDKQTAGRRLFLFPDRGEDPDAAEEISIDLARQSGRVLVLTPRMLELPSIAKSFREVGMAVLTARDIEESLEDFTTRPDAALVLANRYDGIDLPDDACRLLIIHDLPAGTNLQERFLLGWMRANALYRDRLRTRFTQAAGRCCRNPSDFATVVVVGQRALDFCLQRENRAAMHPELQAEIEFGLENSKDAKPEDFLAFTRAMMEREPEWAGANEAILSLRAQMTKEPDPVAITLNSVVAAEVDFAEALWRKDYLHAVQRAIDVAEALDGSEVEGYQAWWYYLAGNAAWLAGRDHADNAMSTKARELYGRAARRSTIPWLTKLARETGDNAAVPLSEPGGVENAAAVVRIVEHLGLNGRRFGRRVAQMLEFIRQPDSTPFESGIEELGFLLGFTAVRPTDQGAPDGVWCISDQIAVAFEAKSDESAEGAISQNTVRQANSHATWVRNHLSVATDADVFTTVITPRMLIDERAQEIAAGLFYLHIDDIRNMADESAAALRRIRSRLAEANLAQANEVVFDELGAVDLLQHQVLDRLRATQLQAIMKAEID